MLANPTSLQTLGAARGWRTGALTSLGVVLTGVLFWLLTRLGERLPPPGTAGGPLTVPASHPSSVGEVLLAIAVIVLVARAVGALFRRLFRQPAVMGEIVAGVMLGPSVLGALAPGVQAALFPDTVVSALTVVARLGVVLFMFLVGLDLDPKLFRGQERTVLTVSFASIAVPFLLGGGLALGLFQAYGTAGVGFSVFALFVGVSLSVTAFPVLARILTERGLQRSRVGGLALGCAAINDATAWCLLALASGAASAHPERAGVVVLLVVLFVVLMWVVARPAAAWLARREEGHQEPVSAAVLSVVYGAMLLCAVTTEAIGIHALFGAFLLGAVMPHDGRLAEQIRVRSEDLVVVLFLPVFFAVTGLRTQLGLLSTGSDWAMLAAIVALATVGKLGGSALTARGVGLPWREAAALGVLMNTRGLMELIVLNVGLELGVFSPTLFAMLVLMAVGTTLLTGPLLERLRVA